MRSPSPGSSTTASTRLLLPRPATSPRATGAGAPTLRGPPPPPADPAARTREPAHRRRAPRAGPVNAPARGDGAGPAELHRTRRCPDRLGLHATVEAGSHIGPVLRAPAGHVPWAVLPMRRSRRFVGQARVWVWPTRRVARSPTPRPISTDPQATTNGRNDARRTRRPDPRGGSCGRPERAPAALAGLLSVGGLLARFPRPWWVAGGWAIDAWAGGASRAHADLEISVLRRDLARSGRTCSPWAGASRGSRPARTAGPGCRSPPARRWPAPTSSCGPGGSRRPPAARPRRPDAELEFPAPREFELFLNDLEDGAGARWVSRRHPTVALPLAALVVASPVRPAGAGAGGAAALQGQVPPAQGRARLRASAPAPLGGAAGVARAGAPRLPPADPWLAALEGAPA